MIPYLLQQLGCTKLVKYRLSKGCAPTAQKINVDCARMAEKPLCRRTPARSRPCLESGAVFWPVILQLHHECQYGYRMTLFSRLYYIVLMGKQRRHFTHFERGLEETILLGFRASTSSCFPVRRGLEVGWGSRAAPPRVLVVFILKDPGGRNANQSRRMRPTA